MLLFSDRIITGSLRSPLFDKKRFDCWPAIFGGGTSCTAFVKISSNGETFKFGGEVALFTPSWQEFFHKFVKMHCFFIMLLSVVSN